MRDSDIHCDRALEFLSPYLDRELGAEAAESVAAHLAACPRCRGELEALGSLSGLLRRAGPVSPPEGLFAGIAAEAVRRQPEAQPEAMAVGAGAGRLGWLMPRLAAALIGALSVGIPWILTDGVAGPSSSGTAGTAEIAKAAKADPAADYLQETLASLGQHAVFTEDLARLESRPEGQVLRWVLENQRKGR